MPLKMKQNQDHTKINTRKKYIVIAQWNRFESKWNEILFIFFCFFTKWQQHANIVEKQILNTQRIFINNECRIMNCCCCVLFCTAFFELLSLEKARIDRLAFIYCMCSFYTLLLFGCSCRCCSILLLYCVLILVTKIWRQFILNKNHWHSNSDESVHSLSGTKNQNE